MSDMQNYFVPDRVSKAQPVTQSFLEQDLATLKEKLGQLPEPMVNPPFVIVSGLPGTGKSFFCRRLAARFPSCIVESDAMRKTLFPVPEYSVSENARLFAACHSLIEQLLREGIPVIFDATNLSERHRERLYKIADKTSARLVLVKIVAPASVTYQRLQARKECKDPVDKSDADWEIYRRMRQRVDRIWRNHFVVDTSRDIDPLIDKIFKMLEH